MIHHTQLTNHDALFGSVANLGTKKVDDNFQGALSSALNATNPTTTQASAAVQTTPTQAETDAELAAGNPFTEIVNSTPASSSPVAAVASDPATTNAISPQPSAQQSFDNTYWANQPTAVQALRGMTNEDQRMQLADQLQQQGYAIDVPIMVWGWDPSITTSMRQSYGYTWVPALGQAPIQMAPGLTGMGQPYNPNNPPPGSIIVPPAAS